MDKNQCLRVSEKATQLCDRAIIITGSARSGTTIVGTLLHSMDKVEYAYEPPMLFSLFALMDKIKEEEWKLLYETYLYEDFFLNSIAGRNINCNKLDDSSIYKVKSIHEIDRRLQSKSTKKNLQFHSSGSVLVYKIPDIVYRVPKLKMYYPQLRVLVVLRGAVETISSLMSKKWFDVNVNTTDLIWPFYNCNGVNVPYWVKDEDAGFWSVASEIDRAAYYYIRVNESIEEIEGRIEIKYESLVQNPLREITRISEILNLKFGDKTNDIIQSVVRKELVGASKIISGISEDLRNKISKYSNNSE